MAASDLYDELQNYYDEDKNPTVNEAARLAAAKMRAWVNNGMYARLFDRPTTIDMSTPWLYFNVEQLKVSYGTAQAQLRSAQATLTVQLAKRTNVSSVTVERGGTATSFAYAVQTSTDGSTWQTVATAPPTSNGTDQFNFKPTQAQYVRLDFPGVSGAGVPDIDEVSVG